MLALTACATPTQHVERLADASGFEKRIVAGDPFDHVIYIKPAAGTVDGFHVYVEGDGTPLITRHLPAADPTSRRPLMLKLMRLDPSPALYLGRPCYMGAMRNCQPGYWTGARYSETVVESMNAALTGIRHKLGWGGDITLIGHSGGGTLAMLLAPRVVGTVAVVTVAANLDIDGWSRLHAYDTLSGSLNPAEAEALPARIRQLHLIGGRDRNVPPKITRAGAARQRNAEFMRFPEYNHHCCWEEAWPVVLERVRTQSQ